MHDPTPPSSAFVIAEIGSNDLKEVARLITDLRTDMNGHVVCTATEMAEVLKTSLAETSYTGYHARSLDGRAIGYIGMNRRFAIYAGGAFTQITELYVEPAARRLGVGRALIQKAEAHTLQYHGTSIEIGVPQRETHPGTHAFYTALGYRLAGPRMSKNLVQ